MNLGPTYKAVVLTIRHSILDNRKLMYLSADGELTRLSSGRDVNPLVLFVHTELQPSECIIKSPVPLSSLCTETFLYFVEDQIPRRSFNMPQKF